MQAKIYSFAHLFSLRKICLALAVFVLLFSLITPFKAIAATTTQPQPQTGTTQQTQPSIANPNPTSTSQQTNQKPVPKASTSGEGTCTKAAGPLSFFLCPIYDLITNAINWLAGPEDSALTGLLRVDPLQFSKDQGLLKAYQNILTFTNGLFILVFFVIIILGLIKDFSFLDNYNFKTVLPRFVAAIILAQFGYLLCAALIDIGNILGTLLPDTIMNGVLPGIAPPALTDGIISLLAFGDTNTVGTGTATTTNLLFGGANGVVFILLFIMSIVVLFALLIAFIYMVARYLILYVLILAAPLAFLAWVLPGTQPFFNKWGRNLIRLILMFPLVVVVITVAQLLSFMLIHPNLDPNVITDDRFKLIIGALVPFVALLMIPKCLKLSGDIMDLTGGAVAGFIVGKTANKEHVKNAGKYSKEGIQNRIAYDDKLSKTAVGRFAVAGVGGINGNNPKAAAKMGQTRDRAQAVYDKAAAYGTTDELKKMLNQNYKPAKVAATTALAKRGERQAIIDGIGNKTISKEIIDSAVTKDFEAFKGMPDVRFDWDYGNNTPKSDFFTKLNAGAFADAGSSHKDWLMQGVRGADGKVTYTTFDSHKIERISGPQWNSILQDKSVRQKMNEEARRAVFSYASSAQHHNTDQAIQIRKNLNANGWI